MQMLSRVSLATLVCAALVLSIFVVPAPQPAAAADCEFVLGFKAMHDMMPEIVGDCKTSEYHNQYNGDGLQETTGGLLVWRKADNWTAFTDGYHTWLNGPQGLEQRLNTERFPWENPVANPQEFTLTAADVPGFVTYPEGTKPIAMDEPSGMTSGYEAMFVKAEGDGSNGVWGVISAVETYKDTDSAHVILSLGSMSATSGEKIQKVDAPAIGDESYGYTYQQAHEGHPNTIVYGIAFRKGKVLTYTEVAGYNGVNIDPAIGYARIVESRIPKN
jgi:hypothetical protein